MPPGNGSGLFFNVWSPTEQKMKRQRNNDNHDVKSWTNNVVEERVGGLRRQRLDEVEKFTQQKDQFVLVVAMCQLLQKHSEEKRRLIHQTVPDHLLSHRTHFTHTYNVIIIIVVVIVVIIIFITISISIIFSISLLFITFKLSSFFSTPSTLACVHLESQS